MGIGGRGEIIWHWDILQLLLISIMYGIMASYSRIQIGDQAPADTNLIMVAVVLLKTVWLLWVIGEIHGMMAGAIRHKILFVKIL
jgi:hypothetical protein